MCLLPSEPPSLAACEVTNAFRVPDGVVLAEGTELSRAGEATVNRGQTVTLAPGSGSLPSRQRMLRPSGCSTRKAARAIGGVSMSLEDQRVTLRFL